MTAETSQVVNEQSAQPQISDKELNFRKQEAMYQKMLEKEREEKAALQRQIDERASSRTEDEDDSDPYVDNRKLQKKLSAFEQQLDKKIDQRAEEKARFMMDEERKNQWLRSNPDFYEIMNHAQTFADKDPEMAETILKMPDNFERQKLVYKTIKAMGIHKKEDPKPSIQEIVDRNKRGPYYQPSGVGAPPYAAAGDFSQQGQKSSYEKMKQLIGQMRL